MWASALANEQIKWYREHVGDEPKRRRRAGTSAVFDIRDMALA